MLTLASDPPSGPAGAQSPSAEEDLVERFAYVRRATAALAEPLSAEDQTVQSMPDASPTKWHLGHTSWFFETFVLRPHVPGYRPFDEAFHYLFNSYYEALGERRPRAARGLVTRPSAPEVMAYRRHVDAAMLAAIEHWPAEVVALGLAHEEQHQELLLTDILHLFAQTPCRPAYSEDLVAAPSSDPGPVRRVGFESAVVEIGRAEGAAGFGFDNEAPRHRTLVQPFELADRLVTNADWLAFMQDGGYGRPELWLSDGWATLQAEAWVAPLYWEQVGGEWRRMTLGGLRPLDPHAPVCHVSLYEADAFARWASARLPTEAEWEHAAEGLPLTGNLREQGWLEPVAAAPGGGLRQMYGDVWEWTQSAYSPYPGFRPATGAVGEYNGKFMINQAVLRGGSCVTPEGHVRPTYRNFFPPGVRWQFSGVRLAWDAEAKVGRA
jgi:ergothioneine biosynthesis protein EgtB